MDAKDLLGSSTPIPSLADVMAQITRPQAASVMPDPAAMMRFLTDLWEPVQTTDLDCRLAITERTYSVATVIYQPGLTPEQYDQALRSACSTAARHQVMAISERREADERLYIEPNPVAAAVNGRAKTADVVAGVCLFGDIDLSSAHPEAVCATVEEACALINRIFPLPPSRIYATGGGIQFWFLADEAITDPVAYKALCDAFLDYCANATWSPERDRSAADSVCVPAHLMRLPGSINRGIVVHEIDLHGRPVVEHRPAVRYSLVDLVETLPPVTRYTKAARRSESALSARGEAGAPAQPPDWRRGHIGFFNAHVDAFLDHLVNDQHWTLMQQWQQTEIGDTGEQTTWTKSTLRRNDKDHGDHGATLNDRRLGKLYVFHGEASAERYDLRVAPIGEPTPGELTASSFMAAGTRERQWSAPAGTPTGERIAIPQNASWTRFEFYLHVHFGGDVEACSNYARWWLQANATPEQLADIAEVQAERREELLMAAATERGVRRVQFNNATESHHLREMHEAVVDHSVELGLFVNADGRLVDEHLTEQTSKHMRSYITDAIQFERRNKDQEWVVSKIEQIHLDALVAKRWDALRPLNNIIHQPFVRPDGTMIFEPGYDAATGTLIRPNLPLWVPDNPTAADVEAAKALVWDVFAEFPFEDETDISVLWSVIVLVCARTMIGNAPLIGVRAHTTGSGKGGLIDTLALLGTGEFASRRNRNANASAGVVAGDIRSLLRSSAAVLALDEMGAEALSDENVLGFATDPVLVLRSYGSNDEVRVSTQRTLFLSGNNLAIGGDQARRFALINLANREDYTRTYKYNGIHELRRHVQTNRSALMSAVLTLVRTWHLSDCPLIDLDDNRVAGPEFYTHIGGVLANVGIEPVRAKAAMLAAVDVDEDVMRKNTIGMLVNDVTTWEGVERKPVVKHVTDSKGKKRPVFGKWWTAREIITMAGFSGPLLDAIQGVSGGGNDDLVHRFGLWLKAKEYANEPGSEYTIRIYREKGKSNIVCFQAPQGADPYPRVPLL